MHIKRKISLKFSYQSFITFGACEVKEIKTYKEFEDKLTSLPKKVLFILDIDYVLLHPQNPLLQMGSLKHHHDIVQSIFDKLSPSERDQVVSNMLAVEPSELLTPGFLKIINSLHKKKSTIWGISSELKEFIPKKLEKLKKLKIRFSTHPDKTLDNFKVKTPIFTSGILFTDGERIPRGDALKTLLTVFKEKYDLIVYVSDKEEDCKEVDDEFAGKKAIFGKVETFQYKQALIFPKKQIEPFVFEKQFSEFVERTKTQS